MESTAWTTDSGAKAIAATWKNQAPVATAMPIANHLDEKGLDGPQRMADVDGRGGVGALVLVEEAELRGNGARKRQQDPDFESHVCSKTQLESPGAVAKVSHVHRTSSPPA